ncbi:MAG: glycosyltransferase [Candidatus Brocadiales bacterium]|nr:glycosyltransferase [Candidatus Brocadiales bacterium]
MAVYNGEKYIEKCVDSLLNTDYSPKSVCVVNDGSTDNTLKCLEKYNSLITVWSKPNGGVSDSRNYAIQRSNADLVGITDADCEVDPLWIKNAIKYFQDPTVGAVTGWLHYRITNTLSAVRDAEYHVRFASRSPEAKSVSCPVALFRREALLKVGGFDTSYTVGGEDTEIGYRLIEAGYRIVYEPSMKSNHAAEESLALYLKRNLRNATNHMRVVLSHKKRTSLKDDFFPFTLRFQPLFTLLLILSLVGGFFWSALWAVSLGSAGPILYNFMPVLMRVAETKGLLSVPITLVVLSLRNIIWCYGLLTGLLATFQRS